MFALTPYRRDQEKTFSRQSSLPKLPVPDLRQSLEGWLKSLRPVIAQKYGDALVEKELAKRRALVEDFLKDGAAGSTIQQRLKDLESSSPSNWLNDTLWTPLAYHSWRAPLLINSNWWLMFKHDPIMKEYDQLVQADDPNPALAAPTPSKATNASDSKEMTGKQRNEFYMTQTRTEKCTEVQVRRAAWLTHRFLLFREKLLQEKILPDSSRSGPFDMYQYTRLFGICRLPQEGCDTFAEPDTSARHINVLVYDRIYSLGVLDAAGQPVSPAEIESRLWLVVRDAEGRKGSPERVGVLSADDRDLWTKNRKRLLEVDPANKRTLRDIETAIFSLSLDPYTIPDVPAATPYCRPQVDSHVRNASSGINGRNRWFDTALTVMVETNGRAGMMGEHSPCDALIPSIVVDFALGEDVDVKQFASNETASDSANSWRPCNFQLDDGLRNELEAAEARANAIILDSDAQQLWWDQYGADWIKKSGKQSPDAFIQMALQMAWYKTRGSFSATYETASTRMFLHGRTEVIRTLSEQSRAFVLGMANPKLSDTERFALLTAATANHNALTRTSSFGKGFDRHLMALKVLSGRGEAISHPLFEDDMWALSQEWKLSTSGLSAGGRFLGTGFGTIWPDGLGTNYLAGPYLVKFGLESKVSGPVPTSQFKQALAESLIEMRRVCEAGQAGEVPNPRL